MLLLELEEDEGGSAGGERGEGVELLRAAAAAAVGRADQNSAA